MECLENPTASSLSTPHPLPTTTDEGSTCYHSPSFIRRHDYLVSDSDQQSTSHQAPSVPINSSSSAAIDAFISKARHQASSRNINSINCFQLNCHKSLCPLDNLQDYIDSLSLDNFILFLQEPPLSPSSSITGANNRLEVVHDTDRPRAAILSTISISNVCTPLSTIKLKTSSKSSDLILCSLYWDYTIPDPPPQLEALLSHARSSSLPLIVSADANAHHVVWGSTNVNKRGETLLNLLLKHNMAIFNDGSKTFHNILRSEAPDITFGNPQAADIVSGWKVSPFLSQTMRSSNSALTLASTNYQLLHPEGRTKSPNNLSQH